MATVTLTLADPTTREDGTAVTTADIAGINIYRTTGDGAAALVGTADPKASPPTFVDSNLVPGNYAYAASAIGTDGRESKHSDLFPVVIAAPAALLSAPTIVAEVTT
jgi:hypothetical protein